MPATLLSDMLRTKKKRNIPEQRKSQVSS